MQSDRARERVSVKVRRQNPKKRKSLCTGGDTVEQTRRTSISYLAALFALALLGPPVDPVVGRLGLLPVLPDADVPEGGLALQLRSLHQRRDAARVGDDLARRALHPGTVLLQKHEKR